MALQLRRLLPHGYFHGPLPRVPPPPPAMLQGKAFQGYPCICGPYSPLRLGETLRFPIKNNSARQIAWRISSRLPLQFESSAFYSAGLLSSLGFVSSRAANSSEIALQACNFGLRFFSTANRKKLRRNAKNKSSCGNVDAFRRNDEDVVVNVLDRSDRRRSKLGACRSPIEEAPPPTRHLSKGFITPKKDLTRAKSITGSKTEVSADMEEKKVVEKKKLKAAKPAKAAGKKNEEAPSSTRHLSKGVNSPKKDFTSTKSSAASKTEVSAHMEEKKVGTKKKREAAKTAKLAKAAGKKNEKISVNQEVPGKATSVTKKEVRISRSASKSNKSTAEVASAEVKASRSSSVEGSARKGGNKLRALYPPTGKSVVVVESATKAKVIQNYLGDMFEVLPSYGHVRDLAGKSRSVRPDDDFSMVWEVPTAAWTHLKSIKVALKGAENLILASDPDREGEAIAWHINEMLQQQDALSEDLTVARVVFHEVTEEAIKSSLMSPRDIDMNLVNAYLARRSLDYLIGFGISPILWRKLPGCPSAGRVQSAALALVCDRETEIEKFDPQEYWSIDADFRIQCSDSICLPSQIKHFDSKKLDQLSIRSSEEAQAIEKRVYSSSFEVLGIKRSKVHKHPPMPYITSSLQQDAANKLHFSAVHTMKVAQKLYEGINLSSEAAVGLITYMRTDGFHISDGAAEDIRSLVKERYGEEYASKTARKYFKKVKNAQEAHEAIRPTSIRRLPASLVGILDDDSLKLYTLIWKRAMACQMEAARTEMVQVDIADSKGEMVFRSVGSRRDFQGYQAVHEDTEASASVSSNEGDTVKEEIFEALSNLKAKDSLSPAKVHLGQHFTKPPPRYSEATLVKELEELGIGRPSTYAPVMKVLQDRKYVTIQNRVLHPEFRGRMVSAFLSHLFSEIADYSFTADMENELDNVSAGATEWKGLLKDYWARFSKYCDLASQYEVRKLERVLEEKFSHMLFSHLPGGSRICPSCSEGTLRFKVTKYGAGYFIGCDQHPKCKYIAKASALLDEDEESDTSQKSERNYPKKLLGLMPNSTEKVLLKHGIYGPYIQVGEDRPGYTPKRASIPEQDADSITLEEAIEVLQYPVTLGKHPNDDHPVVLTFSKYGFTIKHRRHLASIPKKIKREEITLEYALKLLKGKNVKVLGRVKGKSKKKVEALDWD